jgi:hypothetical protein
MEVRTSAAEEDHIAMMQASTPLLKNRSEVVHDAFYHQMQHRLEREQRSPTPREQAWIEQMETERATAEAAARHAFENDLRHTANNGSIDEQEWEIIRERAWAKADAEEEAGMTMHAERIRDIIKGSRHG